MSGSKDKPREKADKPSTRQAPKEDEPCWPCNVQIERELIGCLLLAGSEYALGTLQAKDFHNDFCALMFSEVKAAKEAKVPINSQGTLLQWFKDRGALSKASQRFPDDTAWHMAEMMQDGVVANVPYYCQVLRELRRKRAAMWISLEAVKVASQDDQSAEFWRRDLAGKLSDFDRVNGL